MQNKAEHCCPHEARVDDSRKLTLVSALSMRCALLFAVDNSRPLAQKRTHWWCNAFPRRVCLCSFPRASWCAQFSDWWSVITSVLLQSSASQAAGYKGLGRPASVSSRPASVQWANTRCGCAYVSPSDIHPKGLKYFLYFSRNVVFFSLLLTNFVWTFSAIIPKQKNPNWKLLQGLSQNGSNMTQKYENY